MLKHLIADRLRTMLLSMERSVLLIEDLKVLQLVVEVAKVSGVQPMTVRPLQLPPRNIVLEGVLGAALVVVGLP
jgi:hypothetical protein